MYDSEGNLQTSWFGGGTDLTPYYLDEEDAKHFHSVNKVICDNYHTDYYHDFKKPVMNISTIATVVSAEELVYLACDYLKTEEGINMEDRLAFTIDSGNAFTEAYIPIVET